MDLAKKSADEAKRKLIKKYSPKVIVIEDHHKKIEDILEADVFKFLS